MTQYYILKGAVVPMYKNKEVNQFLVILEWGWGVGETSH
jgi:hypothetical protein